MSILDYKVSLSGKAKNLRLKVTATEGLTVVVPRGFDERRIPEILARKKEWIADKLEQAAARKRFMEPEPFLHLPERLSLRALRQDWHIVYREERTKTGLWLRTVGSEIIVAGAAFDHPAVIAKLMAWLRHTVREELFPVVRQIAAKNRFDIHGLMVKSQRTRWASCSSKRNLSLNTKLLFLPPELVRYAIVHELCHTVHMNHSAQFWRLVASYEPAYRTLDRELREGWKQVPTWAL